MFHEFMSAERMYLRRLIQTCYEKRGQNSSTIKTCAESRDCHVYRQASPFLQATKALRVSRGIALLFLGSRYQMGAGGQPQSPAASSPGKDPLYRRLGEPQGRSGQVRKISPPTGIRSPDRPARIQKLYRLRYPVLLPRLYNFKIIHQRYDLRKLAIILSTVSLNS